MPKDSIDYGKEAVWFDQMVEYIMKMPGYSDNIELISKAGLLEDIRIEASAIQNALFEMDSAGTAHGFDYRTLHPIKCQKEADWLEKAGDVVKDAGLYLGKDKTFFEKARELYTTAMYDYEMAGKLYNKERVYFKLISLESELIKGYSI